MSQILIRADASVRTGTGHMMRCLALAKAWQRAGGTSVFACAEVTPVLQARLIEEGFQTLRIQATSGTREDAAKTVDSAIGHNARWIVADSYSFGLEYQRTIKAAGVRLLFIDDHGTADGHVADLVLDQNLGTNAALYPRRDAHTRLLLGPRYALLREEFLRAHDWTREIPAVGRKVLVTLGGSDPDNITALVVQALQRLDLEMRVVVGGSSPHFDLLSSMAVFPSSVIRDAANMSDLMAWADVAVIAGGTTSWESACMGLPCVVLVLAENQRKVAAALAEAQIARTTTPDRVGTDLMDLLMDEQVRRVFSRRARQLVDGYGASRVATCIAATYLDLRRVGREDCRLIWEWANEPEARAVSISTEAIPWEAHQKWFAGRVDSPSCLFYIARKERGENLGQIRYDIAGETATVSLSLAREARGHGLGPALIWRGSEQCFADSAVNLIRAYIKPDNQASIRAFFKGGFADQGTTELNGTLMRQFVMRRDAFYENF